MQPTSERPVFASLTRISDLIMRIQKVLDPVLSSLPLQAEPKNKSVSTPLQARIDDLEEQLQNLLSSINL